MPQMSPLGWSWMVVVVSVGYVVFMVVVYYMIEVKVEIGEIFVVGDEMYWVW